jgi:hypothetical protein
VSPFLFKESGDLHFGISEDLTKEYDPFVRHCIDRLINDSPSPYRTKELFQLNSRSEVPIIEVGRRGTSKDDILVYNRTIYTNHSLEEIIEATDSKSLQSSSGSDVRPLTAFYFIINRTKREEKEPQPVPIVQVKKEPQEETSSKIKKELVRKRGRPASKGKLSPPQQPRKKASFEIKKEPPYDTEKLEAGSESELTDLDQLLEGKVLRKSSRYRTKSQKADGNLLG